MLKILLIEDNKTIAQQICEFLSGHQWEVDYACYAQQGINLALSQSYDVVLLDLNLPDMDGLKVCKTIKEESEVSQPILMVTARDAFEHKAAGFKYGADDYLTKPFDLRELVLRCQALAKRHILHTPKILELGELSLNTREQTACRQNKTLPLTTIGFKILEILMRSHPAPVSRTYLSQQIWGEQPPDSDALKSHIYALRKEMDKPFAHPLLKTIHNVGFKLDIPDEKI